MKRRRDQPARQPADRPAPGPPSTSDRDDIDIEIDDAGNPVAPAANDTTSDDATTLDAADHRRFVIKKDKPARLDVYLHNRLKGISRSRIQKLIDLGGVTVNDRKPKASTTIKLNDVIDVILPAPAIRTIEPEPIPLDILYEDDDLVAINKQAGLIVHPARSHLSGTLVNALAYHFKQQQEQRGGQWSEWRTKGFRATDPKKETEKPNADVDGRVEGLSEVGADELRPGIVHRLDKNTTGVMVVAKNDTAHWQIARQFEARTTVKAYLAIAHGNFDEPSGVIDAPIGKHPTAREAYAIRHDSGGRPSVTIYRVREQYKGYALVELELKTGRTHQIRVHLSYLGHPIVGDIVYGGEPIGRAELDSPPIAAGSRKFLTFARDRDEGLRVEAAAQKRPDLILAHPALHAAFLRFTHPRTQQPITFTAPMHDAGLTLLRELRQRRITAPTTTHGTWVDLAKLAP